MIRNILFSFLFNFFKNYLKDMAAIFLDLFQNLKHLKKYNQRKKNFLNYMSFDSLRSIAKVLWLPFRHKKLYDLRYPLIFTLQFSI